MSNTTAPPADVLASITDADRLSIYAGALTDGMVAVEFHYAYADDRGALGLEVTVYATDGSVITSQDYG